MSGIKNDGTSPMLAQGNAHDAAGAAASGGNLDLPELMLTLQTERMSVLDTQLRGQMDDMKKRTEWLRMANAALNALRAQRPAGEDDKASMGGFTNLKGETQSVLQFMNDHGIPVGGGDKAEHGDWTRHDYTQQDIQTSIENLKSAIDTANSHSQADQIRMQGLMEARNQAYEQLSSILTRLSRESIKPGLGPER